jgi:DedD protein
LTGAIILVAVIVLLVPELLSGPRARSHYLGRSLDEPPLRSYTVDLREGSRGVATAEPSAAPGPPPPQETAPATPAVADVAPPAPTAEARPPSPPVASPPRASVAPSHAVAHSSAAHHGAATTTGPGWSVQLGSFASRENAERLAAELRTKGFGVSVSEGPGAGRKWFRVRVGPAPDRAAALALAGRLRAVGHTGSVVSSP